MSILAELHADTSLLEARYVNPDAAGLILDRLTQPQLEQLVSRDFTEARLGHGAIRCTSTPRRLAVLVSDLEAATPDLEEERKGPPAAQAFKDGVPTPAAEGFARRCGIPAEQLEVRDTPKGPFVFARVLEQGWQLPAAPRWCVGFSDCSALLLAQWAAGSIGGVHGWFGGDEGQWQRLVNLLEQRPVAALQGEGVQGGSVDL